MGRGTQTPSTLRYSSAVHDPPVPPPPLPTTPPPPGAGAGGVSVGAGAGTAAGVDNGADETDGDGDAVAATGLASPGIRSTGAVGPQPVSKNRRAARPAATRRPAAAGSERCRRIETTPGRENGDGSDASPGPARRISPIGRYRSA